MVRMERGEQTIGFESFYRREFPRMLPDAVGDVI
jgi:hypothetical protein